MRYPNAVDPVLGYAPGSILTDDLMDFRSCRIAEKILLDRYNASGYGSIHNLMALIDNCRLPDYFAGPEYEERYLAGLLSQGRLDRLAKAHMGGGPGYEVQAFNRTTAAILTACLALVPSGTVVPFLVPRYPKATLKGHGHPAVPRSVTLAGARTEIIVSASELEGLLATNSVPLVIVCASYRGLVSVETLEATCKAAKARGVPVFIDDASGARTRTIADKQPRAIDLGADLVVTSCEKYGLDGPRAGLMVGRKDLMERIGAKAAVLGTEARPSVAAAIVRALTDFTDERGAAIFAEWNVLHQPLFQEAKIRFGNRVSCKDYSGISILVEDILEIAMERAGLEECEFAPVDAATALAMILLKRHGYMTVPALHYPGASKNLGVHLGQQSARSLNAAEIVGNIDAGFDALSEIISNRDAMTRTIFGSEAAPRAH